MIKRPVTGEVPRRNVDRDKDQSAFKRSVNRTHYLNTARRPMMRGGIRL